MEFIIGFISIVIGLSIPPLLIYTVYGNWKKVKRELDDAFNFMWMFMFGLFFALILFITGTAFNNTFWHIDYVTTEGMWKTEQTK